jgi:hypothetical protein
MLALARGPARARPRGQRVASDERGEQRRGIRDAERLELFSAGGR